MTRILTIMGSGETSPTMMKPHRDLLARLGAEARAVVLDTPYGFQENAPELAARAVHYFAESVGHRIDIAGLTRIVGADPSMLAAGLARIQDADYVFSGPGSPTYALRQWSGSPVHTLLADKLRNGGIVTFASAAALTLGSHTVPVYEIYKAGQDPQWLEGLGLMGDLGIPAVVIPHYDNTEGGHHDTRFCYLGERRLALLERELPDDAYVLGVDEHTGLVIDLEAGSATVVGNGNVTIRRRGSSTAFPTGSVLDMELLLTGEIDAPRTASTPSAAPVETADHATSGASTSLAEDTARLLQAFDIALRDGDASGATSSALELEAAITAWSADTLQSDAGDRARVALRSMIIRLGEAAVGGLTDPAVVVAPFVDVIMSVRTAVRTEKRFDLSDLIRDGLITAGVEVRDTPDGPQWSLRA
ncbi:MAG: hypothetical protein AB7V43_06500 [Acidimicrobiia bacterium]